MLPLLELSNELLVDFKLPFGHKEGVLVDILLFNRHDTRWLRWLRQCLILSILVELLSVHLFGPLGELAIGKEKCVLD